MAYNPNGEYLAHLRRIVTGLFDFRGRSRRSEFAVFLFAIMVIELGVAFFTGVFTAGSPIPALQYVQFALWLLAAPLFVRRLHDQNRSGWLALILPVHLGLSVYAQFLFDERLLLLPRLGFPWNVAEIVLVLSFWVFVLWPGTDGENRFGPDPRAEFAADLH